jgi:hypothetical protein
MQTVPAAEHSVLKAQYFAATHKINNHQQQRDCEHSPSSKEIVWDTSPNTLASVTEQTGLRLYNLTPGRDP